MGDKNLHEVLKALSSPVPSPAAASAASVSAAAGASLLVMIAEAAARRLPEGAERVEVEQIGAKAGRMRDMLEDVYEQDVKAYARVLSLLRKPAGPERNEKLERAWKSATIIPGAMGRAAMICLRLTLELAPRAPRAAKSDIVTAAWMCHAAVQASLVIVHSNLNSVADEEFRTKILRNLPFLDDRDKVLEAILKEVGSQA